MPLPITRVLKADFTNIADSNFAIFCNDRKFEVHEVIIREHTFFDNIFTGGWKEAQSRELHITEDETMMTAIIRYMYGADDDEVLSFVNHSRAMQALWEALKPTDLGMIDLASDFGSNPTGNTICAYDEDPGPSQSRIAAQASLQVIDFYIIADKYQLDSLLYMLYRRLQSLISTAWNHSDVLDVIDAVFSSIRTQDKLYIWLFEEIALRLPTLLAEHRFKTYIETIPELYLKIGIMTMEMVGREHSRDEKPVMRYCCYSDDDIHTHCRRNTEWIKLVRHEGYRVCSNCMKDAHEFLERIRLWVGEDVQADSTDGVMTDFP